MDITTKTRLYKQLAKDYSPKMAEMRICKYVEALEERIAALEAERDEDKEWAEKAQAIIKPVENTTPQSIPVIRVRKTKAVEKDEA